jgi:hypothetical protein
MAILHQATLIPSKLDLLTAWLPGRSWFPGSAAGLERVTAWRFDDPAGEVGLEHFVVRAGAGPLVQVPLSYRAAPLPGAEDALLGTTEHSVLGTRWVYDACADPVYAAVLAEVLAGRAGQAEELVDVDGVPTRRDPIALVTARPLGAVPAVTQLRGLVDGDPAVLATDTVTLVVARVLTGAAPADALSTLTGTWEAQPTPLPLAFARPA